MKKRLLVVRQNVILGLLSLLMLFGVTSSARAAGARTKITVVVLIAYYLRSRCRFTSPKKKAFTKKITLTLMLFSRVVAARMSKQSSQAMLR